MSAVKDTLDFIKKKRDNAIKGIYNSIPSPFRRFSSQYLGIEQATYYLITAATKIGKTQITNYLCIFSPILYSYNHNKSINLKIFYFPLEETKERVTARFMSYLLYLYYNIEIDYRTLISAYNTALDKSILDKLESSPIKEILEYYDEVVEFIIDERNPTGVYNTMKKYAESVGKVEYQEYEVVNDFGIKETKSRFKKYIPNDPNSYVLTILDHGSIIDTERGFSLKESMDKVSEYFLLLANRYFISPVLVQQQIFFETSDNIKVGLVRPTLTGLSDSKYTSRSAHVVLGLHSPFRSKEDKYHGYDVTILKDRLRILEVLANRNGETGGQIALYFNGKVCEFKELPRVNNEIELDKIYEKCKRLDEEKVKKSEEFEEESSKENVKQNQETNSIFSFFNYLKNKFYE